MKFSRSHTPAPDRLPGRRKVERLGALPLAKSLAIAFQSLRVRGLRSLITTLSLVLAVAFLGFVAVTTDVANGLLATGDTAFREALIQAGYDLGPADIRVETSPKQRWIVLLSLLVCGVGIVNAQLMAVTERFREIGTMKCLGALSRFILRLFLLEAGLQGLAGGVTGALIGAVFAVLNGLGRFGPAAFTALPWPEVAVSLLFAVGTGFILSLIGVLYPAILAARMQPVDAMRMEY